MELVVTFLPDSVPTCSLKEQKNLNSFFAVMFGVSNTAVSRLAKTWEVTAFGLLPALRGPPRSAVMDWGPLAWAAGEGGPGAGVQAEPAPISSEQGSW